MTRVVHVEHCMGTVCTIDIRDPGRWDEPIAEAVAWLHHVDAVFSTYRPDSELSRIHRGELTVAAADPAVSEVLELCALIEEETGGYFTARWGNRIDPTGVVKGWAVQRAGELLRVHGSHNHAINGGGDVWLAGEAAPGQPWRVGIADPHTPGAIRATVAGRDFAVATSGTAERGAHIVNPFTGRPATDLAAVTVTGPDLTRADAYATAAVAMGSQAFGWVAELTGYHALLVRSDELHDRVSGSPPMGYA